MQPDGLIPRSPGVPGSLGHGTWLGRSALGLAALCLSWVAVSSAWICDDYYYSLRAAYNLVHGHGLVSNPVERVQGFSNPLWTLLLSASVLVDGYSWAITIGLSLVISLVVVVVLARWSAPNMGVALVGLSLLAGSKAFMDYSTSGLENTLAHLLYLGFLTLWAGASGPAARAGRLGLLAALLVWTRLDLCLLVLPHLLLLVRRPVLGTVARLAAGMLPLAAWLAFALIYYGSPFPNSAWTKLGDAGLERGLGEAGRALVQVDAGLGDQRRAPVAAALGEHGLGAPRLARHQVE